MRVFHALSLRKQQSHPDNPDALARESRVLRTSQVAPVVKNLPAKVGDAKDVGSVPGSGRFPGGGHGNPLPAFLPGKFPEQRSLAGYSPRGRKSQARPSTQECLSPPNKVLGPTPTPSAGPDSF